MSSTKKTDRGTFTAYQELDQLLEDRFEVNSVSFVAALRAIPAVRPRAAALSEDDAHLLDAADFGEDSSAHLAVGAETAADFGRLAITAFTAREVADGLGVSASRVRQKRLARELWAIADGRSWVFPLPQFERGPDGGPRRVIRGLDRVFKALPGDLHPVAINGFLHTPQAELTLDRELTPLEWLRGGGDVDQAVAAAEAVDWYGR
ncbi:hypothetical protein H7J77_11430 [Mycolicibacillus parakoreensis]|uniref:DNA-binding protein n=1 Tax=Mycolicibacillus parakoreensis TaxID=1069221 RepID=A0ABY3TX48_9MYCO|nr:hypothetical protein [Mycolicibacillus parakoreensis]MCV7316150.1 hypothetical protein [Mycolicibacillus parakoreensis]ULN52235.1 hypothetical protein MIU77_15485 [Mycolicibacillus parakoreensis]